MRNDVMRLTPRQSAFLKAYTAPESLTFSNAYKSARHAGYTEQTAKNIMHLQPEWLSESIGQFGSIIAPDQIMQRLTAIINDADEPTVVKLKAIEMAMKAYSMLVQRKEQKTEAITLNVDLSGKN